MGVGKDWCRETGGIDSGRARGVVAEPAGVGRGLRPSWVDGDGGMDPVGGLGGEYPPAAAMALGTVDAGGAYCDCA